MNGDSVRVRVWTGTCAVTTSAAAALFIEGPIIVTDEPDNDTICSGGATSFTVAYTNPGAGTPTIHWEYSDDNGSSWDVVPNSAPYSGVGGLTLDISAADSTYNGYLYRAVFTLTTCGGYYSDEAKLVVQGPIRFRGMPQDVTTCAGEHAYFELFPSPTNGGAGTVLYQWQALPPMASNWVSLANDTLYSGTSSVRLTIVNVAGLGGTQYRAIIRTGECARDTSDAATLFVEGSMTFDREPEDATVCSGGDTIFVAAVTNGGVGNLNYQWQRSLDGVTGWTNISDGAVYSGTTNDTLTVLNTTGLNGVWYRMISYVGTCTPIATRRARLTVEGPINVTAQPQSVTDCNANSVFFRILANAPVGTIQYRWERRRSPSDPWIPTVNDTTIVGSQTDSIALLDIVADSFNGNQFRVRYWTNVCNSAYSNIATITIEGPVTITDMPDDTTVCSGQPAFFEITANNGTGGTLTYVWQVSTNGVVWSNVPNSAPYSGIATSRLDISNVAGLGGRRYRCMVFTGACDPVYSDPARLTVNGPVTFVQPSDQLNVCANAEASFTTTVANLGSGVMSFTWQVSEGDSLNWMDVTEPLMSGNYYDGENTTTLFINQVADSVNAVYFDGNYYRLRVSLATCDDFFSRAALFEVVTDTLGHCDFDLDGDINDIDEDDDDDGVPDDWEYGCLGLHNYDVDADNNGTIDGEEDNDGDQFNNREELDEDGVFDGDPCDPCSPIISINCFGISLRLKTMLYGASLSRDPLNPNGLKLDTMMMKDDLRTKGLIPLTDPYANKSGFTHAGDTSLRADEYIADSLAVLGVEGDDAIVDWVFIELRSANELDSVIATKSALLQRDGDVVRTDGVSPVTFDTSTLAGPYYVVIRHRNHLGVMTIDAPELSPQLRNIDMRDTTFKFHGKHSMYRGTYNFSTRQYIKKAKYSYQWAGDLTHDGKTVYQGPTNDGTQIFLDVLAAQVPLQQADPNYIVNANYIREGYLDTDFDLNGQAIFQGPFNDRSMILVNSILLHPGNEHRLSNFIMLEQLP